MPKIPVLADDIAATFENLRKELEVKSADPGLPPLILEEHEIAELGDAPAVATKRKKLEDAASPILRRSLALALKHGSEGWADLILAGLDVKNAAGQPDPRDNLKLHFSVTDPELLAAVEPLREIVRIYQGDGLLTANEVVTLRTMRDLITMVLGKSSGRLV